MRIDRRAVLRGGVGVAALAVGAGVWRARARLMGGRLLSLSAPPAGSTRGIVCVGSASSPTPVTPVRPPLHLETLARFVDPLPIPRVRKSQETRVDPRFGPSPLAYHRVVLREGQLRVHRDVPPTPVWGYDGEVPGATFETRSGEGLLVAWVNELPEAHFLPIDRSLHGAHADQPDVRAVVHVHGARVPPESDGFPEAFLTPGQQALFHYPSQQDAATLWYHDHAMGIERLNQYAGLFGLFLVRDAVEDALDLPKGPYEIPLILCDRLFDADGQLRYPTSGTPDLPWVSEVHGDAHLLNGKLFPFLEVEPRAYRFRVVNAANSRFYDLSLSEGRPFQQIGSDQGLLPSAITLTTLSLAPGERADLIVDFSAWAGQTLTLRNAALDLMQIRVAPGAPRRSPPLPGRLRSIARIAESEATVKRSLTLNEYKDAAASRMLMLLDGKRWQEPVSETPKLGSVEIWSFVNLTEDTHPIHLHLVRFQVLDRQPFDADEYQTSGAMNLVGKRLPPEPGETGWKDTVQAHPGAITRIAVRFEGYAGRYVWHCHVLEHAANEMMRPFEVVT